VELSCTRRSFPALSTMLIWSPLQTRMTCPSIDRSPRFRVEEPGVIGFPFEPAPFSCCAYRNCFFSLAVLRRGFNSGVSGLWTTYASAVRNRSMKPPAASIPACHSTTRARPLETRCSPTLPLGCITIPINMLAGGGGPDAVDENAEGAGAGSDSSFTRTSRWSRRLSVKNLAC
jgi:hypothetical protein